MKIILITILLLHSLAVLSSNLPADIVRIMKSGNGRTIETAFLVNSVDEEYDLLHFMKLKPIFQKLHIKDGYFYDAIQTNTHIIYFKIITRKLPKKAKIIAQIL
jgi:hypothetical protein